MTPAGEWDDVACGSSRQFICKKPDLDSAASTASAGCNCGEGWVTVTMSSDPLDTTNFTLYRWTPNLDTHKCYKRVDSGTDGLGWAAAEALCKVTLEQPQYKLSVTSVQPLTSV